LKNIELFETCTILVYISKICTVFIKNSAYLKDEIMNYFKGENVEKV